MNKFRNLFVLIFVLATTFGAEEDDYIEGLIKLPKECKGKLFCSIKPEGYDELEAEFTRIVPKSLLNKGKVSQREGDGLWTKKNFDDDGHHCPYSVTKEVPYMINLGGKIEVVIQIDNLFRQEFSHVQCENQENKTDKYGAECFQNSGFGPMKVKPTCQLSDTMQTVFVYKNKTIEMGQRPIPSCCSCQLEDL